jgi:hypothetical protein
MIAITSPWLKSMIVFFGLAMRNFIIQSKKPSLEQNGLASSNPKPFISYYDGESRGAGLVF